MNGADQEAARRARRALGSIIGDVTDSELLIAVAYVRCVNEQIAPDAILAVARRIRKNRAEPTGKAWSERLARNNGVEYQGGPTCWDPSVACEGICLICPNEGAVA